MPSVIGQDNTASGFDPALETPAFTYGVWGDTGSGTGVVGSSSTPAPAPASHGGAGVFGVNNAVGGLGVRGRADDPTGTAVLGWSAAGTGVAGQAEGVGTGVTGTSTEGSGISGVSASGIGVSAESAGAAALRAVHPTTDGGTAIEARLATADLAGDFAGDVRVAGELSVTQRLGVGTPTPQCPVGIRAAGSDQRLLGFEDASGTTRWHLGTQTVGGSAGLNVAETGVAEGRLFLAPGGKVGVGTTSPTHPLHVPAVRGIRQNMLHLSGGPGWSSIAYNAHHNDANNAWAFPDSSRPAVTIELDDFNGIPRFDVYTAQTANAQAWQLQLAVNGKTNVVSVPTGRFGVRTSAPQFELHVNGTACATQFCNPSDIRGKRDMAPVAGVLDRLSEVRAITYRAADRPEPAQRQVGVIAQEVEAGFPELVVAMGSEGLKAVDYNGLVGVLVAAVNELGTRNAELAERLAAVEHHVRRPDHPGADDAG